MSTSNDEVIATFGGVFREWRENLRYELSAGQLLGDGKEDEDVVQILVVLCDKDDVEG
jgi:hypothetical protein